jgi:hypothetical protein
MAIHQNSVDVTQREIDRLKPDIEYLEGVFSWQWLGSRKCQIAIVSTGQMCVRARRAAQRMSKEEDRSPC